MLSCIGFIVCNNGITAPPQSRSLQPASPGSPPGGVLPAAQREPECMWHIQFQSLQFRIVCVPFMSSWLSSCWSVAFMGNSHTRTTSPYRHIVVMFIGFCTLQGNDGYRLYDILIFLNKHQRTESEGKVCWQQAAAAVGVPENKVT